MYLNVKSNLLEHNYLHNILRIMKKIKTLLPWFFWKNCENDKIVFSC